MRTRVLMAALMTMAVPALVLPRAPASSPAEAEPDLAAARSLFDRNLDAIRQRDRAAYLDCYLQSDDLARTGPEGPRLGYKDHAEQSSPDAWPDLFEGRDLHLVRVLPGVVYGTYRYRVRYGSEESVGISERIFLKTSDGWRIAMTSAFPAPAGTPPPPRALVGATLVDGTGAPPVNDAVVIVRGGKIDCAGSRAECAVPDGVEILNLRGFWLTPGLVDAHVHFSQTGWADGRPDSIDVRAVHPYERVMAGLRADPDRFFRSYLCSGVTAVFDVGGYPWTWALPDRAETDTMAPHVAAAGPLLSTLDHWVNLPAERQFIHLAGEEEARAGVRYLAEGGAAAAKVWFITGTGSPFEEMAKAVMAAGQEAKRLDLPLIVHATGLREAKVALQAGARLLVHSVWDQPVDEEFLTLARASETTYCPTLTVMDGYQRLFASTVSGEPPEVDDPAGCVDRETLEHIRETPRLGKGATTPEELERRGAGIARWREIMAANLRRVRDAGIPVAMGTDAGNPLTLHGPSVHAEMEAMSAAGLTPMQVLVASTRGGASAMGRLEEIGTIDKGKVADLLVLAADPIVTVSAFRRVQFVMRGGELRSAEELRAP